MFTYRDYIYQVERHRDNIAQAERQRLAHSVEHFKTALEQPGKLVVATNEKSASLAHRMLSAVSGLSRMDAQTR